MEDEMSTEAPIEVEATPDDPILSALSDDESETTEASEVKEEATESPDQEVEAEEEEESETQLESTPEDEQTDQETDPEELRKEEARRRYEERERARAERKARVESQTQEYVEEAEDDTDRRLRAMEVQQYNQIIEHNENTLIGEFERVKVNPDLQIFNPDNKEAFNPRLYEKAIRDYNAGYLTYDQNGNMVGIKGSLYQYLTETAEIYQAAINSGQIQQVRAERKMKTNADTKPAATPKAPTKDLLTEALSSDD